MLKIAALNSDSSEDESVSISVVKATTKEAQECEVFSLYNQALTLERQGLSGDAKHVLENVLQQKLVKQAVSDEDQAQELCSLSDSKPILALKYSAYKNIASIYYREENWDEAIKHYLEAVLVDASEVSVWYKIGTLALKIHNYALARHAFEQGLLCNSNHWPCLDHVITVMYALGNYNMCLYYISRALTRDAGYVKGLVFMKHIYDEQPSLQRDTMHLFQECDSSIYDAHVEDEETQEYVNEALNIRHKRIELSRPPERPELDLVTPLHHTWTSLGECLIALYDHVTTIVNGENPQHISYSCRVKLTAHMIMNKPVVVAAEPIAESSSNVIDVIDPATITTPSIRQASSANSLCEMDIDTGTDQGTFSEDASSVKKPGKRKRLWAMQEEWGGKRRSTRVRNVVHRKQEESINYQQLLTKFLPNSLRFGRESDDPDTVTTADVAMETSSNTSTNVTEDLTALHREVVNLTATEGVDVLQFLRKHENNGGVISLMGHYLTCLQNLYMTKWPACLVDVYVSVGERYGKHIQYPDYICRDVSDRRMKTLGEMCLLLKELKVDKWMNQKSKMTATSGTSPRKSPGCSLGPDYPGSHFTSELDYLSGLAYLKDVLQQDWESFNARVNWVSGKFMLLENKLDVALDYFERTLTYLKSEENPELSILLPNISHENLISIGEVLKQKESLERCQSLEEVHRLHQAGDYIKVVELLLQTFTLKQEKLKEDVDRMEQLVMLQESLFKLKDYKKCIMWTEVSLDEALKRYNAVSSKTLRNEWLSTVITLMKGMDRCLVHRIDAVKCLPSNHLTRLTQNMLWLLDTAMDVPDTHVEMSITTPLPWILLYRLIDHEEQFVARDTEELPSAIMLLNFAHECLGRRSWCVSNDGSLLLFIAEEFLRQLKLETVDNPHPYKEDLQEAVEQAFYCLYGHPNKRTKAKHLRDHNVPQIELTWQRAAPLFDFFKPKSMPEYDSYRTSTVSAELENLLKRVVLLIPPQVGLTGNTIESVTSYIEGTISQPPCLTDTNHMPIVSEVYYLLADYYFKNKESGKAIKFYLHDLCVNPERFDSWAGMALARSSRLEQRLNSHELKNEPGTIQKQANSALRCFRRALELDSCNSKLWIEYGNLAYQVHSYLSRTLKQHSLFPLTEDVLELTRKNKAEMLRVASSCYTTAGSCDEDGTEDTWFQHYMSGKIAEKMGDKPQVFLQHYKQAAECLHEDRAKYPKRITYILSPPYLSVESLEVFYRLHVSVVKYLLKNKDIIREHLETKEYKISDAEIDNDNTSESVKERLCLDVLKKYVVESLEGPFATSKEKDKPKVKISDRGDAESSENWTTPISTTGKVRTPTRASRLDHTYSSMSRRRQMLSDTSQDSSPLYFLSTMTPQSSAPSSGFNTPYGSSPRISDVSLATPTVVSSFTKMTNELPAGITPIEGTTTRLAPATTSTAQSVLTTGTVAVISVTTSSVMSQSNSDVVTVVSSTRRKPSLSFSMDSILGITSDNQSNESEKAAGSNEVTCKIDENVSTNTQEKETSLDSLKGEMKDDTTAVVTSLINHLVVKVIELSDDNTKKKLNEEKLPLDDKSLIPPSKIKHEESHNKESSNKEMDLFPNLVQDFKKEDEVENSGNNEMEVKKEKVLLSESDMDTTVPTDVDPPTLWTDVSQHFQKTTDTSENLEKPSEVKTEPKNLASAALDEELKISRKLYLASAKTPPPPPNVAMATDVNISPPKLMSPVKPESAAEDVMPQLEKEMPILEMMEKSSSGDDDAKEIKVEKLTDINPVEVSNNKSIKNKEMDQSDVMKENKDVKIENDKDTESKKKPGDEADGKKSADEKVENNTESDGKKSADENAETNTEEKMELGETEEKDKDVPVSDLYVRVLKKAMKGLEICLGRFPQHYKSLYRLSQVYYISTLKDTEKSRDLLMGNTNWSELPHMPCVGLFQEKKQTNFFMGLWRIPVEDIDRSGSFATHIAKSLWLMFDVLKDLKDYKALYQVHLGLNKTPEQGKKYLRDSERTLLARTAYIMCFEQIKEKTKTVDDMEEESAKTFLLEVYKYWQHGVRQQIDVKRINTVFSDLFKALRNKQGVPITGMSELESAIKYCTQLIALSKPQVGAASKVSASSSDSKVITSTDGIGQQSVTATASKSYMSVLGQSALSQTIVGQTIGSPSTVGQSVIGQSTVGQGQSLTSLSSMGQSTEGRIVAGQKAVGQTDLNLSSIQTEKKLKSAVEPTVDDSSEITTINLVSQSESSQENQLGEIPNPQKLTSNVQGILGTAAMASNSDILSMFNLTPAEMEQFLKDEEAAAAAEREAAAEKTADKLQDISAEDLEVIVIDESNIEINLSPKKISPVMSTTEKTDLKSGASNIKTPTKTTGMILSETTGLLVPSTSQPVPQKPSEQIRPIASNFTTQLHISSTIPSSGRPSPRKPPLLSKPPLVYQPMDSQDSSSSMSSADEYEDVSRSSSEEQESSDDDVIVLSSSD